MKPHMRDGSCKLDGGDGTKCMNPQQSGCFFLFSLSCFLFLPQQQFSHSLCLSCFLSPCETGRSDARQVAAVLNGRRG